jgi:hypothetical protein
MPAPTTHKHSGKAVGSHLVSPLSLRPPRVGPRMVLCAVFLALAGCSSADSSSTPDAEGSSPRDLKETVRASYQATVQARTARMAMSVTAPGNPEKITMDGALGFRPLRANMRIHTPGQPPSKVRLKGKTMWVHIPRTSQGPAPGIKTWLKAGPKAMSRLTPEGPAQLQQRNPAQSLVYLRAVKSVTKAGTDKIRGVATTQYLVDIDLTKLARSGKVNPAAVNQLRIANGNSIGTMIWVDHQGRVRREQATFALRNASTGQKAPVRMTLDLYHYGVPVVVKPPPKSNTIRFSELAKAGAMS